MRSKYTEWEFENLVKVLNPDVQLIGKYKNAKTKIRYICKQCGGEFESLPSDLLKGKLHRNGIGNKCKISNYKTSVSTRKDLVRRIKKVQSVATANQCSILESEDNAVLCKCNVCGNQWRSPIYEFSLVRSKCTKCN